MATPLTLYPNALRTCIKRAGYSFREVSRETAIPESTLYDWAAGNRVIPHKERQVLAHLLGCAVELLAPNDSPVPAPSSFDGSNLVKYSQESPQSLRQQQIGLIVGDEGLPQDILEISDMDKFRREILKQSLKVAGALLALRTPIDIDRLASVFTNPTSLDISTLLRLEGIVDHLWWMSNNNETTKVERVLPIYLPQIVTLAHQPTKYQRRAAHLASQLYILSAEVERSNVIAMKAFCQQAVLYSEIAENYDIQVASIKQQATIFLVDKQPLKALGTYQRTLPFINQVTPLLRSRVYLGLASACARCGQREEALTYLGLACDHFPRYPEDDPNFLYTVCSTPVLYLYESLTYTDLKQPEDAWKALMQVDGLHPKMPVPESTRIEFINLQARTAAQLGNMEQSEAYLRASVSAASTLGYSVWLEEAHDVYTEMLALWFNERRIKDLAVLFE